jgi:cytochrome d ubiquinol oxidase subunit II
VVAGIAVAFFGYVGKPLYMFISSLVTMGFYIITGYVGTYPYALASRFAFDQGLEITDIASRESTLLLVLIIVGVLFPIVISYQIWKYIKFSKKVKLNDE